MAITLRTNEEQDKLLEQLRRETRENTNTKAILKAAQAYRLHVNKIARQERKIKELENQLDTIHEKMKQRQDLTLELASLTAQKSLY